MITGKITGSIVALVTPMRADGAVDHEALAKAVDRVIEAGSAAIVSVGTTGESATLDVDEHTDVIRRTIDVAAGRVPIIAGTGANSTAEAIHLTEAAKAAGADAALLVTPYYNKPPQEGLYRHFKAVAEAVDIPQILYNVPGRTAVDMLPATVERLAELPDIVGIKEAKGDLDRVRELVALGLPDFALYSGDDATARDSILLGLRRRHLRHRQRGARGHGPHVRGRARGRRRDRRRDRRRPRGPAPRAVRRAQPDPGQVGARRAGPDRRGHPAPARAARPGVPRRGPRARSRPPGCS